jgi:hypothetical protein
VEDEVLHEAEDRRAECIRLQLAVDVGDFRDASASGALGAVDDSDVAAGAPQVVGGDEAIDAGTDDYDGVGQLRDPLGIHVLRILHCWQAARHALNAGFRAPSSGLTRLREST